MLERFQHLTGGNLAALPGRRASICLAVILIATLSLTPIFGRAPAATLVFFLAWLLKRHWALPRMLLIFAAFALAHMHWAGGLQALAAACVFLVAHGLRKWVRQSADATLLACCLIFPVILVAGWAPLEEALRWAAGFALGAAVADLAVAAALQDKRISPDGETAYLAPIAALAAIINILTIVILDIMVGALARSVDDKLALTFAFMGERLTLPAFLILALLLQLYSRQLARALEARAEVTPASLLPGENAAGNAVAQDSGSVAYEENRGALVDASGTPAFRSISGICFDAHAGRLVFCEDAASHPGSLQIHPADASRVIESVGRGDTILTFRARTGPDFEPMLLAMSCRTGKWRWESGILLHRGDQRHYSMALAQRARHADLGARIMTIAHELRQPLFTISVAAESQRLMLARADRSDRSTGQIAERAERIAEQVIRATAIIEQILSYGRTSANSEAELDVAETLRRSCAFLAPLLEERAIELDFSIEDGRHCTIMSPVELEQVFVNALQNAADSIVSRRREGWTGTGRITCSVATCDGLVSCIIADNGAGVSPRHAEAAFNAFFSTKADEGTGLGLFITREIILRAGGNVSLRPSLHEGALLAIELPATGHADQMSSRASRIVN